MVGGQNEKRLYSCRAYIKIYENNNGYNYELISYNTKICTVVIDYDNEGWEEINVKLWRYPSNTSQKHIHKFAEWLRQNIVGSSAGSIVELLQRYLVATKSNYGKYDGQFKVFDLNCEQLKKCGFQYGYSDL